ncbi:hypothetical protein CMQ_2257 [Grosmannia clavigera kw1407]|uniref:Uncharacterized protein n=1 Tax=Grosmannia clavigera (strain kw1407 / UAMH 11150) TaxID=655863 RepID=F0XJJ8_GROCL|nr:uncharacterized protein CMQ_2257 [Grosmannia clavigera kw1407]EFX02208.1 hypothetical protein CMQ_2257 [Grosmannia clavigera kw1407]
MKCTLFLAAVVGASSAMAGNWTVTAPIATGTGTASVGFLPTGNGTYTKPTAGSTTTSAVTGTSTAITAGAAGLAPQALFGAVAAVAAAVLTL